jgi:hypothetical protein
MAFDTDGCEIESIAAVFHARGGHRREDAVVQFEPTADTGVQRCAANSLAIPVMNSGIGHKIIIELNVQQLWMPSNTNGNICIP